MNFIRMYHAALGNAMRRCHHVPMLGELTLFIAGLGIAALGCHHVYATQGLIFAGLEKTHFDIIRNLNIPGEVISAHTQGTWLFHRTVAWIVHIFRVSPLDIKACQGVLLALLGVLLFRAAKSWLPSPPAFCFALLSLLIPGVFGQSRTLTPLLGTLCILAGYANCFLPQPKGWRHFLVSLAVLGVGILWDATFALWALPFWIIGHTSLIPKKSSKASRTILFTVIFLVLVVVTMRSPSCSLPSFNRELLSKIKAAIIITADFSLSSLWKFFLPAFYLLLVTAFGRTWKIALPFFCITVATLLFFPTHNGQIFLPVSILLCFSYYALAQIMSSRYVKAQNIFSPALMLIPLLYAIPKFAQLNFSGYAKQVSESEYAEIVNLKGLWAPLHIHPTPTAYRAR